MTIDPYSQLFADEKEYGQKYKDHLFEQYKLYVEMADNISNRRSSANGFFLTVNTFLLSGLSVASGLQSLRSSFLLPIFGAMAGGLFCFSWILTVRSYKGLNQTKFDLINRVESRLPVALFRTEWEILKTSQRKGQYRTLTQVENWVPKIFAFLYLFYAVATIVLTLA